MRILCIVGAKNILNSNNSTDIINSTVFEGLKDLGNTLDLVSLKDTKLDYQDTQDTFFEKRYFLQVKEPKIFKSSFRTITKIYTFCSIFRESIISPYDLNKIELTDDYDLILVMCPPSLSAVLGRDIKKIKKYSDTKLIQYWSDPMTGSLLNYNERFPLKRIFHLFFERYLLKQADEIVYITQCLYNLQKYLHPKLSKKMRWVDVSYLNSNLLSNPNPDNTTIKLGYFGSYNSNVRNVLPLVKSMEQQESTTLIIRGDTNIHLNEMENLDVVYDRIPLKEISQLESQVDILISIGNIKGLQIPGKTFYYANHNKPIIFIADGLHNKEIIDYLSSFNRYIICENNPRSIQEAIIKAKKEIPDFTSGSLERMRPTVVARSIINSNLKNV